MLGNAAPLKPVPALRGVTGNAILFHKSLIFHDLFSRAGF